MPDIDGILRKEDFDTDAGLRGRVMAMMDSLAPAVGEFAGQKGIDFNNGGGIYPSLAWREWYTAQEDGWSESILKGQITVMKEIIIYPAQDLQGLLCVKVIPSAMKVLGRTVYSRHVEQDAFTQASEKPLLGSLNRAYDYLSRLKPADITYQTDAQVLA